MSVLPEGWCGSETVCAREGARARKTAYVSAQLTWEAGECLSWVAWCAWGAPVQKTRSESGVGSQYDLKGTKKTVSAQCVHHVQRCKRSREP